MNGRVEVPKLLKIENVAEILGCSRQKVWGMVGRREIDSVLVGRSRRIPLAAVQKLIDESLVPAVVSR